MKDAINNRFDELIGTTKTYWMAYEEAENEHILLFGKCRYKNYESFRQSRRDWVFKKT